jgi:hypothetical protein
MFLLSMDGASLQTHKKNQLQIIAYHCIYNLTSSTCAIEIQIINENTNKIATVIMRCLCLPEIFPPGLATECCLMLRQAGYTGQQSNRRSESNNI